MLLRIGDKVINCQKIQQSIDTILRMRQQGLSQKDVAQQLGIDRTFISRLESLGEVRKGKRMAIIGFPVENCQELVSMAKEEGVEFCLLLSDKERWNFVENKSGVELFNQIMEIISTLHSYDIVIIIGSNMRIKLVEMLLDKEVVGVQIGESPIAEDKYVSCESIRSIIRLLQEA